MVIDIVTNLKSASAFERFPCFNWFNWKAIQIKQRHVSYSGRHLITTSFPPVFALGRHPEIATQMAWIFHAEGGAGARSPLLHD
jgi:hypothetical protein